MNFKAGNIFYFTPFYFSNGNTAKPKYFIVLKEVNDKVILVSLPTRKDSVPSYILTESGCIEKPEINFNSFIFDRGQIVTECGKSFPLKTFIYGFRIDSHKTDELNDIYRIENIDYEFFGQMLPKLFKQLITCLSESKAVKRKFIRILKSKSKH